MLKPALLTEAEILNALRDCYDPNLKLNLVDLGMIYAVATEPDPDSRPAWPRQLVRITMTLAMQDSPGQGLVLEQVHNRLAGMQQISKVQIDLVWEPRWTPQQINAAGLKQLEARSVPADPQVLVQITGVRNPA